jgi:hypothetical protein
MNRQDTINAGCDDFPSRATRSLTTKLSEGMSQEGEVR